MSTYKFRLMKLHHYTIVASWLHAVNSLITLKTYADILRFHLTHWSQAHLVEFTQGALVHNAGIMQVVGGLMDRAEGITSILFFHRIAVLQMLRIPGKSILPVFKIRNWLFYGLFNGLLDKSLPRDLATCFPDTFEIKTVTLKSPAN